MATGLLRALSRLNNKQRRGERPVSGDCQGAAAGIVQGRSSIHIMQHSPADSGFPFRSSHPRRLMEHLLRRKRAVTSVQATDTTEAVGTERTDEVGNNNEFEEAAPEVVLEPYEPVQLNSVRSQFADLTRQRPTSSPLSCDTSSFSHQHQQQQEEQQVFHDTSLLLPLCNSQLDSYSDDLHMDIALPTRHKDSERTTAKARGSAQSSGTYADAVNTTLFDVEDAHQPVAVSAEDGGGAGECSPVSTHTLADSDSDGHNACRDKHKHTTDTHATESDTIPVTGAGTIVTQSATGCSQLGSVDEEDGECRDSALRTRANSAAKAPEAAVLMSPSLDRVSERCAAHLGSRNELWCESCNEAICSHCSANAGRHQAHAVVKLSAAYDDTFEDVEAMQIILVRRLTETRQRNAVLGAALDDVNESYVQAQESLDQQLSRDIEAVERRFVQRQKRLQTRIDACGEWRGGLEETLRTVQLMVEELSPAQLVARRGRVLRLLEAAERARPADWNDAWQAHTVEPFEDLVRPSWHYTTLDVPRVLELGRRRGHVRVSSGSFTAHGAVWRLEARRNRGQLGEPCLSVTVTCVEGGAMSAFGVSMHLAAAQEIESEKQLGSNGTVEKQGQQQLQQQQHFLQECNPRTWSAQESHEFVVCTLDDLQGADVLDGDNDSVVVRFGVRAESFRSLALAQQERILALEQRVAELQSLAERSRTLPSAVLPLRQHTASQPCVRGAAKTTAQINRPHKQLSPLSSFGPAVPKKEPSVRAEPAAIGKKLVPNVLTKESAAKAQCISPAHGTRRRANSSQQRPVSSPSGRNPQRASIEDSSPLTCGVRSSGRHRRALSLTSKLRRQTAIPFPLVAGRAGSVQSQPLPSDASSTGSDAPSVDGGGRPGKVLRRLSGWVRSTEDRVVQHARRMRQQLTPAETAGLVEDSDEDGGLEDWTFLDKSPAFALSSPQVVDAESPLARRSGRRATPWLSDKTGHPPTLTLPPPPSNGNACSEASDDGFAFDGMADIEREQVKVDARAAATHTERQQQQQLSSPHSAGAGLPVPAAGRVNGLQGRYESIVQRVDALQLIANTVDNSGDGFSERTLRRISSELAILADARRRRVAETSSPSASDMAPLHEMLTTSFTSNASDASLGLVDNASGAASGRLHAAKGRRSVSMDPADIRNAVARAGIGSSSELTNNSARDGDLHRVPDVTGRVQRIRALTSRVATGGITPRRVSGSSVASTASSSSSLQQRTCSPTRIAQLSIASSRRNSDALDSSSSSLPNHGSVALGPQELTPQAKRCGGILKPGRTRREVPARLHQQPAAFFEHSRLAHISVRTPQGPGRFTEYVASTPTRATGADDHHISAASRSGGSNSAGTSTSTSQTKDSADTPLPPKSCGRSRQVRSARAARKCVRFPEEQRLLETIRLIDPCTAQSIESRAAKGGLSGGEGILEDGYCATAAPLSDSNGTSLSSLFPSDAATSNIGDSANETPEDSSQTVHADANSRPQQQLFGCNSDDLFDVDNIFADTPDASSCKSPDMFCTATSLLFDEATDQPITQPTPDCVPTYRRPPIPPPAHYIPCLEDGAKESANLTNKQDNNAQRKVVRCKDAVFFDHAVLSPTLAAMAHGFAVNQPATAESFENMDDDSDGALSVSFEDALSEMSVQHQQFDASAAHTNNSSVADICNIPNPLALAGLGMAIPESSADFYKPQYEHHTRNRLLFNSRGLAVGPNVGSTPSSPASVCYVAGPANSSSNPSPSVAEVDMISGTTDTACLHSSETSVFVDAAATRSFMN
ncbi:hypothetical protein H4R24_005384 [Coemansia sp. RSA 988]|nr:hypothetical protein H4R24_005384 [Coemansia sp. RSA 988]